MTIAVKQLSKRILIADDDPVLRDLLTNAVRKEGYEAVAVDDGREAYRMLQGDGDFRAGIFDMMMPHLEGLDIIRYMNTEKRLQRIPVLLISSEGDLHLMAKSFSAGATVFLTKPFNLEQFQTTLRILLTNKNLPSSRNAPGKEYSQ
ncbi:MAG: two-component system, cell cycle response regulator [Pyrinomonadaceae bacterium]|jgi:DNA-binding response OmpR family regulator|nr:two-component system, cell cycle response regulator [Pyrinomonadaceae bacterium]